MESRETRGMVSRQFNLIEIQLKCLQMSKYISFYSVFWRNRSIETIDGYDGTVHRGPFQLSRSRPISIDGPDDPRGLTLKKCFDFAP